MLVKYVGIIKASARGFTEIHERNRLRNFTQTIVVFNKTLTFVTFM